MTHNGWNGYHHFPINPRITYIIRDNKLAENVCAACRAGKRYTVFVTTGDHPDVYSFAASLYVCSTDNYVTACDVIDEVTERARMLKAVVHADNAHDIP